jgi:hypothetical protein
MSGHRCSIRLQSCAAHDFAPSGDFLFDISGKLLVTAGREIW